MSFLKRKGLKKILVISLKREFLLEIFSVFFILFIPGIVWGITFLFAIQSFQEARYEALLLLPFVASLTCILVVFLFRLLLPKLKPGIYDTKTDLMPVFWYLHMCLNRGAISTGLLFIIRSSNILKYLHLKALGAKVAYTAKYSMDLVISDPSLVTIESDVAIGGQCFIASHLVIGRRLVLGKVHLKRGAFIAYGNVIAQGTVVGEKAVIGIGNYLYRDKIPDNEKLGRFAWSKGSPKAREATGQKP